MKKLALFVFLFFALFSAGLLVAEERNAISAEDRVFLPDVELRVVNGQTSSDSYFVHDIYLCQKQGVMEIVGNRNYRLSPGDMRMIITSVERSKKYAKAHFLLLFFETPGSELCDIEVIEVSFEATGVGQRNL